MVPPVAKESLGETSSFPSMWGTLWEYALCLTSRGSLESLWGLTTGNLTMTAHGGERWPMGWPFSKLYKLHIKDWLLRLSPKTLGAMFCQYGFPADAVGLALFYSPVADVRLALEPNGPGFGPWGLWTNNESPGNPFLQVGGGWRSLLQQLDSAYPVAFKYNWKAIVFM